MNCDDCRIALEVTRLQPMPGVRRVFNPACFYCGARYFQLVMAMKDRDWMLHILDTWEKYGHDRAALRELAMGSRIPYQPRT